MSATQRELLLAGLEDLRRLVATALLQAPTGQDARQAHGLALVKLCRGAGTADVQELAGKAGLLALPLEEEGDNGLARLLDVLEWLSRDADRDPETGLPGGEVFVRLLDLEIERAVRTRTSLSLGILRLSHCGGETGLAAQVQAGLPGLAAAVAEILGRHTRRYDTVARLAADEFALLFPGAGLARTRLTLERILLELDRLLPAGRNGREAAVCAGLAGIKGLVRLPPAQLLSLARGSLEPAGDASREGRVFAAPIPDMGQVSMNTLVHSQEKQFLFTGRTTEGSPENG